MSRASRFRGDARASRVERRDLRDAEIEPAVRRDAHVLAFARETLGASGGSTAEG
jgi:hypothetical protein